MSERSGAATFQGNPLTIIGDPLAVGSQAPEFTLLANDLSPVTLADSAGKARLISVVPSLDTPVCDQQTRRFNEEVGELGDKIAAITVSSDLPFAQGRWCGAAGCTNIQSLSDHFDMAFGDTYGVHIKELRLLQRAVFVIDGGGTIRHAEYVKEVTEHPDYDKAMAALKEAIG
jgi:thiol peroxidase